MLPCSLLSVPPSSVAVQPLAQRIDFLDGQRSIRVVKMLAADRAFVLRQVLLPVPQGREHRRQLAVRQVRLHGLLLESAGTCPVAEAGWSGGLLPAPRA